MRMPRSLLCLALLSGFPSQAGEGLRLEAIPAWEGVFQPGRMTEIELRVYSPYGGRADIEIRQGSRRMDMALEVEAGRPKSIHLPLKPLPGTPVEVRATLAGGILPTIRQEVTLSPAEAGLLAVVAGTLPDGVAQDLGNGLAGHEGRLDMLAVAPAVLPKTPQGYGPIDVLILDFSAMGRLDRGQLTALYHYLAECGRLVALDSPPAAAGLMRQNAGCGGEFLGQADAASLKAVAQALLDRKPPGLPSPAQLGRLMPDAGRNHGWLAVLALLGAYFILLPLAARFSRRSWPVLALPFFAAGLALLAWSHQAPALALAVWMETASGQGSVRYGALLQASGKGLWQDGLSLPPEAAFQASTGDVRVDLNAQTSQPADARVQEGFFLLSATDWSWQGSLALQAPLTLKEKEGSLTVANVSRQTLPPGWVGWHGAIYDLPSLSSGGNWSPLPGVVPQPRQGLLPRTLAGEGTAALIPFFPDSLKRPADIAQTQGWLLVRAGWGEADAVELTKNGFGVAKLALPVKASLDTPSLNSTALQREASQ